MASPRPTASPPRSAPRRFPSRSTPRPANTNAPVRPRRPIDPVRALHHSARQIVPLLVERGLGRRLAGALVPSGGVALVSLDAMQVGVHPGPVLIMRLLTAVMGAVPVALGNPPQRLQRQAQPGRRRRPGQRRFELIEM